MQTPEYGVFRSEMKEFLDPNKEVEIYHFKLKKNF